MFKYGGILTELIERVHLHIGILQDVCRPFQIGFLLASFNTLCLLDNKEHDDLSVPKVGTDMIRIVT